MALPGVVDTKGREVQTVVARHLSDSAALIRAHHGLDDMGLVLKAYLISPGDSISGIAERGKCLRMVFYASGQPNKSRVQRCINRLSHEGFMKAVLGQWTLTKDGKSRAKSLD